MPILVRLLTQQQPCISMLAKLRPYPVAGRIGELANEPRRAVERRDELIGERRDELIGERRDGAP
jgi:hypothetical protein